jgi:hypothetical protein
MLVENCACLERASVGIGVPLRKGWSNCTRFQPAGQASQDSHAGYHAVAIGSDHSPMDRLKGLRLRMCALIGHGETPSCRQLQRRRQDQRTWHGYRTANGREEARRGVPREFPGVLGEV